MRLKTWMLVVLAMGVALTVVVAVQAGPADSQVLFNILVFEGLIVFPFLAVILRVLSSPRP